jgi:hypothetical protein
MTPSPLKEPFVEQGPKNGFTSEVKPCQMGPKIEKCPKYASVTNVPS